MLYFVKKMAKVIKKLLICLIVFFSIRYLMLQTVYPIVLSVDPAAGLVNVQDRSVALVDKITYRFRNPQKGELVMFLSADESSSRFKNNFQRFFSQDGDTLYLRGDLWPDKIPSVAVSKNQVVGRIIIVPLSLVVLATILPLLIVFLVAYYLFRKK